MLVTISNRQSQSSFYLSNGVPHAFAPTHAEEVAMDNINDVILIECVGENEHVYRWRTSIKNASLLINLLTMRRNNPLVNISPIVSWFCGSNISLLRMALGHWWEILFKEAQWWIFIQRKLDDMHVQSEGVKQSRPWSALQIADESDLALLPVNGHCSTDNDDIRLILLLRRAGVTWSSGEVCVKSPWALLESGDSCSKIIGGCSSPWMPKVLRSRTDV